MNLSDDAADRFVKLYTKLMFYAGVQRKILPDYMTYREFLVGPIQEKLDCRQAIYMPVPIFDDFLAMAGNRLSMDDKATITDWKQSIFAKLVMFRHLKNHTVFLTTDKIPKACGVLGLSAPLGDMVPSSDLPTYLTTALLPFEGAIVCDGLIVPDDTEVDSATKLQLNNIYKELKADGHVVTSFAPEE